MYDVHGFVINKKDSGAFRLIYTSENGMDKQKRGDLSSRSFFSNDLEIVPAGKLNQLISAGITVGLTHLIGNILVEGKLVLA